MKKQSNIQNTQAKSAKHPSEKVKEKGKISGGGGPRVQVDPTKP